jgi:RNA polymerase sigma factor (sigma-70 family)
MNHNEIESCVISAKTGNQEALLKVLIQFKPFIFKTAQQFNIKNYDVYDLSQIGYIALINAVTKYKIGSHTFSSYAFNAIKNEFKYIARQNAKFSNDLSLNSPMGSEDNTMSDFIEVIPSDENLEEDLMLSENINEVRKAVSTLPEDEIEFVVMVYYSGVTLKAYAEKKGISYHKASVKRNNILNKLKLLVNK